ncbi:hypothetical protein J2T37_000763 [Neisseria perflava]|nr:hypothetical protein [Neisseria perflava]
MGHSKSLGLDTMGAALPDQPVKPVAVRIAFKTVNDKNVFAHLGLLCLNAAGR